MSKNLPKGYQIVYIKESIESKPLDEKSNQSKVKVERHSHFLVGELYDEQFPLNLFSTIPGMASDVYFAGQSAIISSFSHIYRS
jgi:hypothetical protein